MGSPFRRRQEVTGRSNPPCYSLFENTILSLKSTSYVILHARKEDYQPDFSGEKLF
jgi:hypothetical protein